MDRGVPEGFVRTSDRDAPKDSRAPGNVALDSDRLPFAKTSVAGYPGFLQSQGIDLKSWRKEAGILRVAELLP